MKILVKIVLKAWLLSATIAAIVNLLWFYINTAKSGNPWSDVIGPVPILVMSFSTMLVGALIYWLLLTFRLKKADIIFLTGAVIIATLSIMGHPKLHDGTAVPPEFRKIDIPMHFVCGLLCGLIVPLVSRKLFSQTHRSGS